MDDSINGKLLSYYNRLYEVETISVTTEIFQSIEFSPLNSHYRPILNLCELFLQDMSIDEKDIGDKTTKSFLIDMNRLFESFIGNLLIESLDNSQYHVDLQKTEYPEMTGKTLSVRIDIIIYCDNKPVLILDTKYQEISKQYDEKHIAQMNLYATSTNVRTCALIYVGQGDKESFILEVI